MRDVKLEEGGGRAWAYLHDETLSQRALHRFWVTVQLKVVEARWQLCQRFVPAQGADSKPSWKLHRHRCGT